MISIELKEAKMLDTTTALNQDPESLVAEYVNNPSPALKDLITLEYTGMVERLARRFSGIEIGRAHV